MRGLAVSIVAGLAGGVLSQQYGDLPNSWAKAARVYEVAEAPDADYLAEVLGCVLLDTQPGTWSFQCGENFLFVAPGGSTRLALGTISNVQVEGYTQEARAYTATVGTLGAGDVDHGVLYWGSCYGQVGTRVGDCVLLEGQGWKLRVRGNRLQVVDPGGVVRQAWVRQ